ncbi:PrsW family glutamic-type intramembrane protease [Natrialba sp. INN-245]|uniref:PrsW family glutamic-type intramembrane protease n=1 Tax=Natrialba sp. INN-245 TaxID=2690967 RepID=UPI0031B71D58
MRRHLTSLRRGAVGSFRRTARIARWEISRSAGTVDRRTIVAVAAILVVVGGVGLSVADDGIGLEDELYVVGVDSDDPYADVATESDRFRTIALEDVRIDDGGGSNVDVVVTRDGELGYVGDNGEQAFHAFREAIEAENADRMAAEDDDVAAYPVLVTVEYQERETGMTAQSGDRGSDTGGDVIGTDGADADEETTDVDESAADDDTEIVGTDSDSVTADSDTTRLDGDPADSGGDRGASDDDTTDTTEDVIGSDGSGSDDAGGSPETTTDVTSPTADGEFQVPDIGATATEDTSPATPDTLSPPFPFQSLVLAFLFIVPMNFVIQTYGSTIMDERIKRRGELLLVSPSSRYEIVAGKTLPYLLGLVGIVVATAAVIGGRTLSVAAAIPIALVFLASTFAGAMLARSFKEMTFVTVTISVLLTTYTFVPAIFTEVTPIALISPLTLVVMDLQGESVRLVEYLFSTAPFYLSAAVLFLLGIGIYREEDMFAQKPVPAKIVDAITSQIDAVSRRVSSYWSPFVLSVVFMPFVFAAQLLAVALLFVVPESIALIVMFVLAAAIEEFAKSIHVYAGFARSRFEPTIRVAAILGALSGLGFFVGEKITHVGQFVGLSDLPISVAAFGPELGADLPLVVLLALFLAPLALHVVTAIISATGARHGRGTYAVAFVVATLVHALYNLGVIILVS